MTTRRHIGPRERLEILTRANGLCHLCRGRIDGTRQRWDVEHVVALALGGDEAKGSENLQPAHADCHAKKTQEDVGRIAKAKRVESRHQGARKPKRPLIGSKASGWKQKIDGTWERR